METLFLPIISILILVMAAALVFLAFAYRQLAEHFNHLNNQNYREHSEALHKAGKIVESAREQSHQMLEKSEKKAEEIMVNADFFSATSKQELGEKLDDTTKKQLSEYTQMLNAFRTNLTQTFAKMSQGLEKGSQQELDLFRQQIQKQTQDIELGFTTQVNKNYQAAQDDLTQYKVAMKKKIDQQATEIIQEVVKEVVPKMISIKDHEELVMDALTQAKQNHAI